MSNDVNVMATGSFFEFDNAVRSRKNCKIFAQTGANTGMETGSSLTNNDFTRFYGLTAEAFHSQTF